MRLLQVPVWLDEKRDTISDRDREEHSPVTLRQSHHGNLTVELSGAHAGV
jgi:hypothetical protein